MKLVNIKSYKKIFILTTILYGVILTSISLVSNFFISKSSLEELSYQKIENTFFEKDLLFSHFMEQKNNQIKSIAENNFFVGYVKNRYNSNVEYVKELFISLIKSDNKIIQIRYIDKNGNNIINLDNNENKFNFVINQSLDNNDNIFFKKFLNLKENEVGISDIELNKIDNKIEYPIKPVMRFIQGIFIDNKLEGLAIIKVDISSILNLLKNVELYDFYLIYKNKDYIISPNNNFNWSKDLNIKVNLKDDFKDYPEVLTNNAYLANNIISRELDFFDSNNIKMVLISKKDPIEDKINSEKKIISYIMLGVIILSLPLSFILATIPERLTNELRKLNQSLEFKVLQKTKELQVLNQELEQRVKDEVKKNLDKDKILFKQSRQAVMGEMISTIAHHWRQPLSLINTIIANLKIQLMISSLDQKTLEHNLYEVEHEIKKLSDIINEFRNFFQPNNKQKEMFELDKCINEAINLAISSFAQNQKNIEIIKNYHLFNTIDSYKNEIIQIFVSVIKNSLEAFEKNSILNPIININIFENNKEYVIEIIDNGGGIDKNILDKVTDPYFSTKLNKNGTGLGLYISKIIAEEYLNGLINIKSEENHTKIILILSKV